MSKYKKVTIDGHEFSLVPVGAELSTKNVVVVRTMSAGVHVGELVGEPGAKLRLSNAHRVWRWKGANSLSELSQSGADTGYTRVSEAVPSITLIGCLEIIPCSEVAARNLRTPRWPT